ncbi:VOC family protein [Paenibacillus sp. P26]|nr:VOC family protein [Paenibacillus sp. P26]UUZ92295.1 VOC family protein [Paenibacillus sp. P25]
MKFDNIRLLVTHFDECFKFYHEKLGFPVLWGELGGGYASFGTANRESFAIFPRTEMAQVAGTVHLPSYAEAQDRFALVLKVDDLEAVVGRLSSEGVSMITDPQVRPDWGIRTAHLRDPDGNLIELYEEIPPESWDSGLREADGKYKNQ